MAAPGWDDIRIFHAIAVERVAGPGGAAARLSEATVARRLKAFEANSGCNCSGARPIA
jgi:hypothetical protein